MKSISIIIKSYGLRNLRTYKNDQIRAWNVKYSSSYPLWRGLSEEIPILLQKGLYLEMGCGDGKTLRHLIENKKSTVAIDFSNVAINSCKKMIPESSLMNIVRADVTELPFKENSFDAVIANHVLEHQLSTGRERLVSETFRVLVPNGKFFLRVFTIEDMRFGKGEEIEPNTFLRSDGIAYHYFTMEEVQKLCQKFILEELTSIFKKRIYLGKKYFRSEILALLRKPSY